MTESVDFSRYQRIEASRQGRVLTLALSNPALMNAVDGEMHRELSSIFLDAADDRDSDIVILTGEGPAFSAGADLNWMKRMAEGSATRGRTRRRRSASSFRCSISKSRSSPRCAGRRSASARPSR